MRRNEFLTPVIIGLFLFAVGMRGAASFAEEGAGPNQQPKRSAELVVAHDEIKRISRVTIPLVNGHIQWNDVLRGLALAGRLDDSALPAVFPDERIDITASGSRLTLSALNLVLGPEIRLQILPVSDARQEAALLVTLDKRQMDKTRRAWKRRIRSAFESGEKRDGQERFGLRLRKGWSEGDPKRNLVVVVHGFNSAPSQISGLVEAIQATGLPSGTYAYPNDQPIADSARRLSRDLKKFAVEHPQRRLSLVTHSMGGLVARAVIEDANLDPGNVVKLIMIAPPTHGSQLAQFSFGVDIWDYLIRSSEASHLTRFNAVVEDGLSEADHDLQPGSDFLRELNARKRNKNVRYSLFLGVAGPLSPGQLRSIRDAVDQAAQHNKAVQLVRPRLQEVLVDLDEVVRGKGDGVVAVKRGQLEGVPDTVLLNFSHLGPTSDTPGKSDRALYEEIRVRLKK